MRDTTFWSENVAYPTSVFLSTLRNVRRGRMTKFREWWSLGRWFTAIFAKRTLKSKSYAAVTQRKTSTYHDYILRRYGVHVSSHAFARKSTLMLKKLHATVYSPIIFCNYFRCLFSCNNDTVQETVTTRQYLCLYNALTITYLLCHVLVTRYDSLWSLYMYTWLTVYFDLCCFFLIIVLLLSFWSRRIKLNI